MKILIELEDPSAGQINLLKQLQESEICKRADAEKKAKEGINKMLRSIGFSVQDFRNRRGENNDGRMEEK